MVSLLRKAARMSLMAMDFVLQVTVEELVLEKLLDSRGMLSFELSRGTKASGLPPKRVTTTRSEWHQTMQMHLTLFLDKKTSRFQDKEYKLRLVQKDNRGSIVLPVLATFTLDASLYAHLGAGPSVEQQVDLYTPKLNGVGGFATVRLRVRCSEPGEGPPIGRSLSAPDVRKGSLGVIAPMSGSLVRPRDVLNEMTLINRPQLPSSQSGLLVGSSFGFSRSGSDSRNSVASTGSSAFSTPVTRPPGRPWSIEDLDTTASAASRRKLGGSKSFNDLDDNDSQTPLSKRGVIGPVLRSSMSFHGGLLGSNGDSAAGQSPRQTIRNRRLQATGVLTSSSSSSVTDKGSKASLSPRGFGFRYDRTATVGYNRLLARFTKGPSPRGIKPISRGMTGIQLPLPHIPQGSSTDGMFASSSEAPPPVLSNLQQPGVSVGMSRGGPDAGEVITVKPVVTVTSSSTTAAAATATTTTAITSAANGMVDRSKGSVAGAVSNKNVVANPLVATGRRTRSVGHLDAKEEAATSATVGRAASATTLTAATTTASVSTSKIGVGTSNTTVAEKANFITATLQQQRHNYSRRSSASGSGGEAGGGGGGGGGKGANAAPPHPSNSIKKNAYRKQEPLKFVRPVAHGGVGLLGKPALSSQIPSLSISSTSNSGGGWSLRTPHPMMGAPRSMESQESGYFGVTPGADAAPGVWMQNEGSAGGDSAEAAPLSSSAVVSEDASSGVGGGAGIVGNGVTGSVRSKGSSQEAMREMHTRVLHLEAALVRSELDLCRSKTELATVRQEMHALRRAKEREEEERASSADISAMYHALEGSVVLLQVASKKMLHLEHCIDKYRGVVPEHVFDELQRCVTQDAVVTSPMAGRRR